MTSAGNGIPGKGRLGISMPPVCRNVALPALGKSMLSVNVRTISHVKKYVTRWAADGDVPDYRFDA